jgi:hypothetical protein
METLADKIRRFNNKYTVNFDPAAILEEARIDAVLDSYKFTKKDENKTRQNTYLKALLETLDESLNAETKIQSGYIYDLSRFDIVKFVREFEEIMNESNMKLAEPKKRKPYEGFDFETLTSFFAGTNNNLSVTIIQMDPVSGRKAYGFKPFALYSRFCSGQS